MKDCFGREIKVYDFVAYATRQGSDTYLSVGKVISYCKNGADKLRVQVFRSNTPRFGRASVERGWSDRKVENSYVATVSNPSVTMIVTANVPWPAFRGEA